MKFSKIFSDAAKIVKQGWCKGDYVRQDGNVCAVGALREVLKGQYDCQYDYKFNFLKAKDLFAAEILRGRAAQHESIEEWNDADRRRKHDVVHAFRVVAEKCRRRKI